VLSVRDASVGNSLHTQMLVVLSKPGGENVIEPGVEPTSSGCMTGDSTTHLKRSAVMSGTGIHRLICRDICVWQLPLTTGSVRTAPVASAARPLSAPGPPEKVRLTPWAL